MCLLSRYGSIESIEWIKIKCDVRKPDGTRATYECIYFFSPLKCLSVWHSFHIHACHVLVLLFNKMTDLYMSLEEKRSIFFTQTQIERASGRRIFCHHHHSWLLIYDSLTICLSRWQQDQNERIPVQWVRFSLLKSLINERMKLIDLHSNHKSITFSLCFCFLSSHHDYYDYRCCFQKKNNTVGILFKDSFSFHRSIHTSRSMH